MQTAMESNRLFAIITLKRQQGPARTGQRHTGDRGAEEREVYKASQEEGFPRNSVPGETEAEAPGAWKELEKLKVLANHPANSFSLGAAGCTDTPGLSRGEAVLSTSSSCSPQKA